MEQLDMEIGTRRDLVLYRLETSRNDLKSAKVLLAIEDYKGANNRAYYAIFHAINAVQAEEIRHASDYDDFYIASREEAERQITVAEEFINLAEKYCEEQLN